METFFTDEHRDFFKKLLADEQVKANIEREEQKKRLSDAIKQRVNATLKKIKNDLSTLMEVKDKESSLTFGLIDLIDKIANFLSNDDGVKKHEINTDEIVFGEFLEIFSEEVSKDGLIILRVYRNRFQSWAYKGILKQKINLDKFDWFVREFIGEVSFLEKSASIIKRILITQDVGNINFDKILSYGSTFVSSAQKEDEPKKEVQFTKFCLYLLDGILNNSQRLQIEKVVLVKKTIEAVVRCGEPDEPFCLSLLGMSDLKLLDNLWYQYLRDHVAEKNFYLYVDVCREAIKQKKCSLKTIKYICDDVREHWINCIKKSHEIGFNIKYGKCGDVKCAASHTRFWDLFYEVLESGIVDEEIISSMLSACSAYVEFLYVAIGLVKDEYGRHKNKEWIHDIVEASSPLASSCCELAPDTKDCFSNIKKEGEKSWKMVFKMIMEKKLSPKELVDILEANNKRKKFSKLWQSIISTTKNT